MCTLLVPEELDIRYSYLMLENLSITDWFLKKAPKVGALQMGPKIQNSDFLGSSCNNLDYI
jgi:hypothetical protein